MFKIWWKSTFSIFLLAFLFLNLLYFGNTIKLLTQLGSVAGDYSNKYFGFSTLIRFFQSGSSDGGFLTRLYESVSGNILVANRWLWEDWVTFSSSGGVYDWNSFWTAIGNFFKSIAGFFLYISVPITFLLYLILSVCWILLKVIGLLSGLYWSDIPNINYDWNSANYFDWSYIGQMWQNIFS